MRDWFKCFSKVERLKYEAERRRAAEERRQYRWRVDSIHTKAVNAMKEGVNRVNLREEHGWSTKSSNFKPVFWDVVERLRKDGFEVHVDKGRILEVRWD